MRAGIIAVLGLLSVLLAGCGMLRLAYGQADTMAFRWLDGYADFDEAQSVQVRTELDAWFAWNRRTQLVDYAELLGRVDASLPGSLTPEATCEMWGEVRRRVDIGVERAVPALANVALSLKPAQLAHIERRYDTLNREYREQYLQPDPARRRTEAVKRIVSRAEWLYGSLDETQRARLATWVNDSPFDARLSLQERQLRQQESLRVLRALTAGPASPEQAQAAIRAYVQGVGRSPRETYRRYQSEWTRHACAMAADLHNSTSPAQRQTASRKLRGWAGDLRQLAGESGA